VNTLLLLGVGVAAAYYLNKRSEGETAEPGASRTLSTEEVQQLTPVQAKVEELQASGQLVTEVKEIVTPTGQTATVIVAPTPDVPNRGVVVDPADLARIQGYYVPKVVITSDIREQMQYHGYVSFDDFIRYVAANRIFLYGPAAMRIKFPLVDWEFWRTNGQHKPESAMSRQVGWDTLLTQEEYNALRDQHGISGLGRLVDWRMFQ